ncbi:MAG: zinc-binding dehydrogenase [Anaerolineae bacterium]|nr:zinc-binding dehydrogenase [Anaerolineae bacterium]
MKGTAVVFTGPNRVETRSVNCPDPGPGDVVVRVTHSWISNGTEGSYLRGERIRGDTAYRTGDPWPFPIVPGYQKVGVVEWVGAQVADIVAGQTVFVAMGKVEGIFSVTGKVQRLFSSMGGHVSPSVSPRDHIWTLPPDADPLAYAGLVLTQVGYNCGTRAPLKEKDVAVVLGDGLVGQWAAQTLAWRGAEVILVGHHAYRLAMFAAGPSRHTLYAREGTWLREVGERLNARGIQVLVDTVGSIRSVEALVPMMRRHGHIVSAGFYGTDDRLSLQLLRDRELAVDMVSGWALERMNETRDRIASGALQTLPLITHHFPVAQAAAAWELIAAMREQVLGVILDWEGA